MKIGQYINYEPDTDDTTYDSLEEHNGSGLQTIERETLNWRVLDIGTGENELEEGTVKIISDPTTKTVTYKGIAGYNNAVKDLNDMCKTLYSHGTTEARSVNLEDFTTSSFKRNFRQNTTANTTDSSYNILPIIYQYEYSESLGQNEQTQWYSGAYNNIKFQNNFWLGNIPSDSPLYNSNWYWLSSRCVYDSSNGGDDFATFCLQRGGNDLSYGYIYRSHYTEDALSYLLRAVVTLPASCTFGTETGDQENPITINW